MVFILEHDFLWEWRIFVLEFMIMMSNNGWIQPNFRARFLKTKARLYKACVS
jgi:hypothetical protein